MHAPPCSVHVINDLINPHDWSALHIVWATSEGSGCCMDDSLITVLFFFKMTIRTIIAIVITTARIAPKMTPSTIPSVLR